jgi:hypothetical protein
MMGPAFEPDARPLTAWARQRSERSRSAPALAREQGGTRVRAGRGGPARLLTSASTGSAERAACRRAGTWEGLRAAGLPERAHLLPSLAKRAERGKDGHEGRLNYTAVQRCSGEAHGEESVR